MLRVSRPIWFLLDIDADCCNVDSVDGMSARISLSSRSTPEESSRLAVTTSTGPSVVRSRMTVYLPVAPCCLRLFTLVGSDIARASTSAALVSPVRPSSGLSLFEVEFAGGMTTT